MRYTWHARYTRYTEHLQNGVQILPVTREATLLVANRRAECGDASGDGNALCPTNGGEAAVCEAVE